MFKVVLKDKSECLKSIKDEDAPLKKLINYNCFTNWRVYGEINERIQTDVYKIEEMCQEKLENMKVPSLFLIEKTFKEILNN